MPAPCRLDLAAIDRSLCKVQLHFAALSELLLERRDPFIDHVRRNMLAGYALIDDYVARGVDLFALQNVGLLLEINATVLCGTDPETARSLFALASYGRRDPASLEQLRATFAKEGIPTEFLSHYV